MTHWQVQQACEVVQEGLGVHWHCRHGSVLLIRPAFGNQLAAARRLFSHSSFHFMHDKRKPAGRLHIRQTTQIGSEGHTLLCSHALRSRMVGHLSPATIVSGSMGLTDCCIISLPLIEQLHHTATTRREAANLAFFTAHSLELCIATVPLLNSASTCANGRQLK